LKIIGRAKPALNRAHDETNPRATGALWSREQSDIKRRSAVSGFVDVTALPREGIVAISVAIMSFIVISLLVR
jgi:hypothetical protein